MSTPDSPTAARAAWPELPALDAWQETLDTLHMWTQVVGKVRLAQTPRLNHWWNVTHEAYSHECHSAGFWPGTGVGEAAFYAYAYPEPEGFATADVRPDAADYLEEMGEFVLPYEAVRTAADPDAALIAFLQSTYEAAAEHGNWDRAALEQAVARV
jgi:hypothetical protein